MLSVQLLKTALFEALMLSGSGPVPMYKPLGLPDAVEIRFDISDRHPESSADLSGNQARVVISGPMGGGRYPVESTYAVVNLQLSVYAIASPDVGFLSDSLRDWLGRLSADDLRMQGQCLNRASVISMAGPIFNAKRNLHSAMTEAAFHLHVER
jgi:hypothetical protein